MTIGNLRAALFEYLIAKHEGGIFILRIEDTDQSRYVEGSEDAIYETLRLTGLSYDEGPHVGGDYGPYIQSQRKADYLPPALRLIKEGRAYYCFCDKDRLESLADERGIKKYDRYCLGLPEDEIAAKLASDTPYVIRQLIPEGKTSFKDQVFGEITIDNAEMEDQILIKSDGMPTYNFANVVDDNAMAITHVVRGCEYLTSTPKYILLYKALGWEVPVFVHLPLLVNESGQKISKRNGDASVPQLLEMGFLPEAIVNYGALLGWSPTGNEEIFTLPELISIFKTSNISKSPSTFDLKKMTWVNGEHIKRLPAESFHALALPYLQAAVKTPGTDYTRLAAITQPRVSFVKDAAELVDFIDSLPEYDIELYTHKKMKTDPAIATVTLQLATTALEQLPEDNWNHTAIGETITKLAEESGTASTASGSEPNSNKAYSKGQFLWPIRTALSGKATTPCGATEIAELLGKAESLQRLKTGLKKLEARF